MKPYLQKIAKSYFLAFRSMLMTSFAFVWILNAQAQTKVDMGNHITDNAVIIDGINIANTRKIQDNLYYYSMTGDYTTYDANNYEYLVNTVYAEFVSLFGYNPLSKENPLLIYFKENQGPNTNHIGDGYRIRIRFRKDDFSARMTYEFSHELTHYFYYTFNKKWSKYDIFEAWNEEIVAEAIALYMLYRLDSKISDPRGYSLNEYLKLYLNNNYIFNLLAMRWNNPISLYEFKELSKKVASSETRENINSSEIRYLYDLLVISNSKDCKYILNMYKYYNDKGYIDYDKWLREEQNTFIEQFQKIQPKITDIR